MTIDRATGTLFLPEIGLRIPPNFTRTELVETQAALVAPIAIAVQNEPWCSYRLAGISLRDTELHISLQFKGEQLISTQLCHSAERFGNSWDTWSEEKEKARKAFHDQWLATQLGDPPGEHAWGTVDSSYDSKGGFSSITLSYA
jgi:hypothetical protein